MNLNRDFALVSVKQKRATQDRGLSLGIVKGNKQRVTAYGESYVKGFLDTGSIPVGSTRKELRIGYNSEFFQLYPFLAVTDDIADAMIYA